METLKEKFLCKRFSTQLYMLSVLEGEAIQKIKAGDVKSRDDIKQLREVFALLKADANNADERKQAILLNEEKLFEDGFLGEHVQADAADASSV